ncbi:MAG: acyltransferase [Paludibacteraceae bacterium]|nr:acyltransferase [Paludibacteraceae bacterium]
MTEYNSAHRNLSIDLTRFIAIILVITQHSWSMLDLDTDSWGVTYYGYRALVERGVPLFIMISGALLLNNSKFYSVFEFYKKRFSRILLPFVLWACIIYIMSFIGNKYPTIHSEKEALINFFPFLLENKIGAFHWFVHMLFVLYLITPLLQRALKETSKQFIESYLLVWVIGVLLQQFYPELFLLHYISPLLTFTGLYLAGFYVIKYLKNRQRNITIGGIGFIGFYLINIGLGYSHITINLFELAETFFLFLCLSSTMSTSDSPVNRIITHISRYSYTIYLIHIPFIYLLYTIHWETIIPLPIIPVITTVIVLFSSSIFCFILDKCPFIPNKWVGI